MMGVGRHQAHAKHAAHLTLAVLVLLLAGTASAEHLTMIEAAECSWAWGWAACSNHDAVLAMLPPSRPTVSVRVNGQRVEAGQITVVDVEFINYGRPGAVDLYLAIRLPTGPAVWLTETLVSAVPRPLISAVDLTEPFTVDISGLLVYRWSGEEPAGSYLVVLFVSPTGLSPGILLAVASASLEFVR